MKRGRSPETSNLPYWIASIAGVGVGLVAAVLIYVYRNSFADWQLDQNHERLWDVVLKAVAGYVAIIGAVITAFKYIDEKRREERKDFLQERQAVYRRLGQSLAKIMNYDPHDARDIEDWKLAKEKFYEIYWGELPLVADEAVMKVVTPFADALYKAKTKEDKAALTDQVSAITKACRKSLGDAWNDIGDARKDIKKAEG